MRLPVLIIILLLAGCQWHAKIRDNVHQGQLLPATAHEQIKIGMTVRDVNNILGSPLVYNFDDTRWEYYRLSRTKGVVLEEMRLVIHFTDQLVSKVELI